MHSLCKYFTNAQKYPRILQSSKYMHSLNLRFTRNYWIKSNEFLFAGCGCNVAFSAYMSQSKANQLSQSMTNGATLIYDRTVSNQHGYYNTSTGIFTAPSSGMYAFTWTLCVDSRKTDKGPFNRGEYGTELMYGTAVIGRLHADTETLYDDDCSTGFVVKYVLANSKIKIRNDYAHQGKLLSTEGHTRTTFSGWKLFD